MELKEVLEKRRSYRALGPAEITDGVIKELVEAARLSTSCFNNQPWRFVFARSPEALAKVFACLNKGNEWVKNASCVAAAFARKDYDCVIKEREYYLFDLGQAAFALQLRAADLGLVAHPIAGFDNEKVRQELGIPEGNLVLTLLVIGKKIQDKTGLSDYQAAAEDARPQRLPPETFYSMDAYDPRLAGKPAR